MSAARRHRAALKAALNRRFWATRVPLLAEEAGRVAGRCSFSVTARPTGSRVMSLSDSATPCMIAVSGETWGCWRFARCPTASALSANARRMRARRLEHEHATTRQGSMPIHLRACVAALLRDACVAVNSVVAAKAAVVRPCRCVLRRSGRGLRALSRYHRHSPWGPAGALRGAAARSNSVHHFTALACSQDRFLRAPDLPLPLRRRCAER